MNNRELASSGQVCSCRGRRRGATLVEFAVVAPIVFLFFFASIELSRMQMLRNAADDAAYEAARTAIIPGGTADEAIAVANRYTNGLALRGVTVTVDPATVTDTTEAVEVKVEISVDQNSWVVPWFTRNKTVTGSSRLRSERHRVYSNPE